LQQQKHKTVSITKGAVTIAYTKTVAITTTTEETATATAVRMIL
jgi:hypothetical protein